ncbi:hypothetical protein HPB47_019476 [Ixodes persulcatus]|uniref:Uncharacterized protein n=1 Tax=Ixodes persulcatus TaxID=34615 RepID=A0AC60QZN0_IXOPE|nr:hypothetical protein HPB47_019476 [Ixodes persulcatus]
MAAPTTSPLIASSTPAARSGLPSSQGLLQAHLFRPAIVPPAIRGFPGPGGAVKNGTFGNLLPSFNATETSPKTSPDVFRTDAHLSKAAQNVSQRVRDVNGTCVCVRVAVKRAIYADITLWCREGSKAEIEERLQAVAKVVEDYAEECRLQCAPEKCELLVFKNPYECANTLPGGRVKRDLSFNEARKARKPDRRVFPGPCGGLGKEEWTWRRLQTDTFVTPAMLHQWYPDRYTTGDCPFCCEPCADVHRVQEDPWYGFTGGAIPDCASAIPAISSIPAPGRNPYWDCTPAHRRFSRCALGQRKAAPGGCAPLIEDVRCAPEHLIEDDGAHLRAPRNAAVCELHFDKQFVSRHFEHVVDGQSVLIERARPFLLPGAVPTVFPNVPSYLSKPVPRKRNPKERLCPPPALHDKRQRMDEVLQPLPGEEPDEPATTTTEPRLAFNHADIAFPSDRRRAFSCNRASKDGGTPKVVVFMLPALSARLRGRFAESVNMDGNAALASEFELPFTDRTPTEREYVCGGPDGDHPAGNERPARRRTDARDMPRGKR